MTTVLGLSRFAQNGGNFSQAAFFIASKLNIGVEQRRSIVNKPLLRLPEDYPEPWDYRSKGYLCLILKTMDKLLSFFPIFYVFYEIRKLQVTVKSSKYFYPSKLFTFFG